MRNLLLILCTSVVVYPAMVGCQSKKVSHYRFPEKYELLKKIEKEVFTVDRTSDTEADESCRGMPSVPDYFGFGRAAESYDKGRLKASQDAKTPSSVILSVYSETNLVDQAARDGFEEQMARSSDTVLKRNRVRKQRQCEFWGVYRNDGEWHDDLASEESNMTTNCYAHLLSSYIKGYRNGYRVVAKIRKSPIATRHGLAHADLGANVLRRAYVYGWYSACYDYFRADSRLLYLDNIPPEGDPRPFYASWLSFFMELEGRFLRENAANKEMVNEEASGISK